MARKRSIGGPKVNTSVQLDPEIKIQSQRMAERRGETFSDFVRRAVAEAIARELPDCNHRNGLAG